MKNIKIPNQFKSLIKVLFTLVILIVIIRNLKLEVLLQHLNGVEWRFLAFASFAFITGVCINTLRLKLLFNENVAYLQLLKINFIGLFFSIFLPGRTSGDVVRGYYIAKTLKNITQSVSILLIWRLIGTFTMVFISCIMSFISYTIIKDKSIIQLRHSEEAYPIWHHQRWYDNKRIPKLFKELPEIGFISIYDLRDNTIIDK